MTYETIKISDRIQVRIEHDTDPSNPRKEWDNVGTMWCWHNRYHLGDETEPPCVPSDFATHLATQHETFLNWCDDSDYTLEDVRGEVRRLIENVRTGYYSSEQFFRDDWPMYRKAQQVLRGGGSVSDYAQKVAQEHYYVLPLYLYDHSGITMRTSSFGCQWDSGQVGYIFVTKEKAIAEWGTHHMLPTMVDGVCTGYTKGAPLTDADYYERLDGEVETYDQYLTGDVFWYVVEEVDEDGDVVGMFDSCGGFFGRDSAEADGRAAGEAQEAALVAEDIRAAAAATKERGERAYWAERDVMTTMGAPL